MDMMKKSAQYPFLLESIKVQHNKIFNLPYHQERILRSLRDHLNSSRQIDFQPIIAEVEYLPDMLFKLRLVYNDSFLKYQFVPYQLKPISSLRLIHTSKIDYPFKYLDRSRLEILHGRRGSADDILIVKENIITDSYYCNVALEKDGVWYTPKSPLLRGTKRQQLIDEEVVREAVISLTELAEYQRICLFNAMIEFGEVELSIAKVF